MLLIRHTLRASFTIALVALAASIGSAQITTRASVDSRGFETTGGGTGASLSDDGDFVAYQSGDQQIYSYDRRTGTRLLVSATPYGQSGNGWSSSPSSTSDGRYVAFESYASNLIGADQNFVWDVFLRDVVAGATELISVDFAGQQLGGDSASAVVSGDGNRVVFISQSDLVVSFDNNNNPDLFVRDRATQTNDMVNVTRLGRPGNVPTTFLRFEGHDVSYDGRYVAFTTNSTNLVPGGTTGFLVGRVYVRDLTARTTEIVSVDLGGQPVQGAWPSISADGRFVAFDTNASNLVPGVVGSQIHVYVRDRVTGTTTLASVDSGGEAGNGFSRFPSISADGRYVAFYSDADNLVPLDTNGVPDIFVHDRLSGITERVSVDSGGSEIPPPGNMNSTPSISGAGRFVTFSTNYDGLVLRDNNSQHDVFVRDRELTCPPMSLYCTPKKNSAGCKPKISAAGSPSVSGEAAFFVISHRQVSQ